MKKRLVRRRPSVERSTYSSKPPMLLTVRDAARELSVSERTVSREIAEGKLIAVRVRGSIRVEYRALEEYVASLRNRGLNVHDFMLTLKRRNVGFSSDLEKLLNVDSRRRAYVKQTRS